MGNYLQIINRPGIIKELKEIFEKHFKLNKDQFKNDFGDLNKFEEIFEIYDSKNQKYFNFKTGVIDKNFYTKEFIEDIKKVIDKEFRFTDWYNEKDDFYGNWQECKTIFDMAVKDEPEGRFSIYDVSKDEGVLFNENCPDYK